MMSKDFKSSLLKSMGSNVKCIQSADQNRRLSTYYNQQEVCTAKQSNGGVLDLDKFLPSHSKKNDAGDQADALKPCSKIPTVSALLRQKQSQTPLCFDKLPQRQKLTKEDIFAEKGAPPEVEKAAKLKREYEIKIIRNCETHDEQKEEDDGGDATSFVLEPSASSLLAVEHLEAVKNPSRN